MSKNNIIVNGFKNLPSLPEVVSDIIESLNNDDTNIESLTSKIMVDPALSTRILRMANSPFYGLSGKISSLKEACMILGTYSIKNMAIAVGIVSDNLQKGNAINTRKLWEHAVGTGVAAKILAEHIGIDHEIAFTAGLLHDIGKIILDTEYPEEYKKVIEYRVQNDCFISEAEIEVLGITHAEIGAIIAKYWSLPEAIIDAIQHHHLLQEKEHQSLVSIIHIADIICRALEIGDPGDYLIPCIHPSLFQNRIIIFEEIYQMLPTIESLTYTSIKLIVNKH